MAARSWLFYGWLPLTCLVGCASADSCVPVVLVATPSPQYSDLARRAGVEGTVKLQVTIGPDGGTPHQIEVVHQLGWGLDEEAVKAVSQWRFGPATCQDQPSETIVPVECSFSGPKSGTIHFGSLSFDSSGHVSKPKLTVFIPPYFYPQWGTHYTPGTVLFPVNEQGVPENFHVEHSAGKDVDRAVLGALRDWRFESPTRKEEHLRAHGTLTYSVQNHP